jgi:hypothetical protein
MKARMKAATFDRKFDAGERITDQLDLAKTRRPGLEAKRVNVDGALHRSGGAMPRSDPSIANQAVVGRPTGAATLNEYIIQYTGVSGEGEKIE